MIRSKGLRFIFTIVAFVMLVAPRAAMACAACFGKTDSKLAEGMNWGILSLLVVVGLVLGAFAAFFIYLAKRSAAISADSLSASLADTTQNI